MDRLLTNDAERTLQHEHVTHRIQNTLCPYLMRAPGARMVIKHCLWAGSATTDTHCSHNADACKATVEGSQGKTTFSAEHPVCGAHVIAMRDQDILENHKRFVLMPNTDDDIIGQPAAQDPGNGRP